MKFEIYNVLRNRSNSHFRFENVIEVQFYLIWKNMWLVAILFEIIILILEFYVNVGPVRTNCVSSIDYSFALN